MLHVFLKPAEFHISSSPAIIDTLLGSCVAVTMFSRRLGLAAMCHAIMPNCGEMGHCRGECSQMAKYLNCILPEMTRVFLDKGISLLGIEAGIFGGANVLSAFSGQSSKYSVGRQNAEDGLAWLQKMGIKVTLQDLGGTVGRKVRFETSTGLVVVRKYQDSLEGKTFGGGGW